MNVEFKTEHPAAGVADHEVLMAFTNDDDALLFRDWWQLWGQHLFGDYAKAARPTDGRPSIPSRQEMYSLLKRRSDELKAKAMTTDERKWYDDE